MTSERLWIVVIGVSAQDDALWYTSVPNLASELWAKVPGIMKTIRVGSAVGSGFPSGSGSAADCAAR